MYDLIAGHASPPPAREKGDAAVETFMADRTDRRLNRQRLCFDSLIAPS